VKYLLPAN